ncbi:hypothetical protein RGQ13_11655 [Thalassotalea psychrophila]|uniref:DUF4760 domain-containing protein n=1 Tax=Thalassotalea psychrophila TaxID=3065647 RepID=A0ABY9TPM6_9GAMM|nr:hypothetical protein RGQ13_11655 [Colwelliaceae bacterium SQ149]
MNEKLSDYSSIAEIISAVAIVLSLIFVGVQLQENTKATRADSAISASTATAQWYIALGGSAENSTLFRNFVMQPEALTKEQRFQAVMNLHAILLIFQNNFYLASEGTLDAKMKDSIAEAVVVIKDQPGWRLYWKERRAIFLPEFQAYIDELTKAERKVSLGIYGDN